MMTAGRDYGVRVIRAPVIRAPALLMLGDGRVVLPVRNYPRPGAVPLALTRAIRNSGLE